MVWSIFLGLLLLYGTKYVTGQASNLGSVTTNLGLRILQTQTSSRNLIFSPMAVSNTMALLYAGANGNTKSQIGKNVFDGMTEQAVKEYMKKQHDTWSTKRNPSAVYNLSYANGIFVQNDYPVSQEYAATLAAYYDGYIKAVDFVRNPESARIEINKWIDEQTDHKIKDVYPERSLDNVNMVLVSALSYKDTWKYKFNEADTMKKDFFTSENNRSTVDMMSQSKTPLYYFQDDKVQVLGLPFAVENKRETIMYIHVPVKRFGLDDIVSTLTRDRLGEMYTKGREKSIDKVELPKFKLQSAWKGINLFKRLGLTDMFDSQLADFSAVSGSKGLFASDITYSLFMEVNEAGGQAVRVDAGIGRARAIETPITFKADQPFLFTIVDKETSVILFMGRINSIQ
jgi:serine protease inhibitor